MGNDSSAPKQKKQKKSNESEKSEFRTVALLGDSVLDNFYWLDNQQQDLRFQLQNMLNQREKEQDVQFKVINYAVDQTQVPDILQGKKPSSVYSKRRIQLKIQDYPTDQKDGVVYPLRLLEKHEEKIDFGILSVGGNDARVIIPKLLADPMKIVEKFQEMGFQQNLQRAVDQVSQRVKNLCLVFVYIPHEQFMLDPPTIAQMMKHIYPCYQQIAQERKLPLINLSITFDPYNRSHYGSTSIQPSNKSGLMIAQLIHQSMKLIHDSDSILKEDGAVLFGTQQTGIQIIQCQQFDFNKEVDQFLQQK